MTCWPSWGDRAGLPAAPTVAELDRHLASAVAESTPRGWRLVKSGETAHIDAVVALAMAVERAQQPKPAPAQLLGWV